LQFRVQKEYRDKKDKDSAADGKGNAVRTAEGRSSPRGPYDAAEGSPKILRCPAEGHCELCKWISPCLSDGQKSDALPEFVRQQDAQRDV
jgi:hypothetical protein